MNRKEARKLAEETLEALGSYSLVLTYEPDDLSGGQSPIAAIHSKSLELSEDAREMTSVAAEIWVSIYVRRAKGQGAVVEDRLDDLVREAFGALAEAFSEHVEHLQIGPSATGYPPKPVDGISYRMERFALRVDDEE